MTILIGSNNIGKQKEIEQILIELKINDIVLIKLSSLETVPEPVEDGNSFLENAMIKAKYYYNQFKIPVICDDSGLVIEALNGEPGIYSARYASLHDEHSPFKYNIEKVLCKMQNIDNRKAYFESKIVYYNGSSFIIGTGRLYGEIINEEKGSGGFGYDPIFYLPHEHKTLAELSDNDKNHISHRYLALIDLFSQISLNK